MANPNLPPGFCGAIADELERIAADLRKVEHVELPEPRFLQLDIQPGGQVDDEIIAAVDTLGVALLGKTGEHDKVSGGPWYAVKGFRGPVAVSVYRALSKRPDDRDAELARLRAEVEQLRADRDAAHAGALDEDNQRAKAAVIASLRPGEFGRVVNPNLARFLAHKEDARRADPTGAVTDEGLVDESEPKCTAACDAMTTRPEITGQARGWHHDDCPVAADRELRDEWTAMVNAEREDD